VSMKLTESAQNKVSELIKESQIVTPEYDLFLRLAVQPGGCSGLRYQTYFDFDKKAGDQLVRFKDFDIRVDNMSWPYLSDCTLNYVESIEKIGFEIYNPAAQGSCACGDSFN